MEITGKLIKKLPVLSGVSAKGEWQKQEFVIEYQEGQYPSQICLNIWGADKISDFSRFAEGDMLKVAFNISAREYQGKWYNDLRAWRIEHVVEQQPQPATLEKMPKPQPEQSDEMPEDDLPF